jgi:hypothetical protein
MKPATIYSESNLKKGKCKCCGQRSDQIVIDDGRCIDCIEEETFFGRIMKKRSKKQFIEVYWRYRQNAVLNYWI